MKKAQAASKGVQKAKKESAGKDQEILKLRRTIEELGKANEALANQNKDLRLTTTKTPISTNSAAKRVPSATASVE